MKSKRRNPPAVGLKGWGVALLIAGALLFGGAMLALGKARDWSANAKDGCGPDDGAMCGEGKTYAYALTLALLPMLTLPASLLLIAGAALVALGVALRRPRPPNA